MVAAAGVLNKLNVPPPPVYMSTLTAQGLGGASKGTDGSELDDRSAACGTMYPTLTQLAADPPDGVRVGRLQGDRYKVRYRAFRLRWRVASCCVVVHGPTAA
jgi:hypothetical protein